MFRIFQFEQNAEKRKIKVKLVAPDGSDFTGSLSGATVVLRKPGAGSDTDVSGVISHVANGWWVIALTEAHTDTEGFGYIRVVKAGVIQPFEYPVFFELDKDLVERHENVYIDGGSGVGTGPTYSNGLLTAGRIRVFKSAADANAATDGAANAASQGSTGGGAQGEIIRYQVSSVDNGDGTFKSWKMTRTLP